mmetsp:Transcript_60410/g.167295  ORF Transcript_60410/g.167295 Transcript_60410/m.167295 type:complete len:246 (+) Transcript_60410:991-1728(+)
MGHDHDWRRRERQLRAAAATGWHHAVQRHGLARHAHRQRRVPLVLSIPTAFLFCGSGLQASARCRMRVRPDWQRWHCSSSRPQQEESRPARQVRLAEPSHERAAALIVGAWVRLGPLAAPESASGIRACTCRQAGGTHLWGLRNWQPGWRRAAAPCFCRWPHWSCSALIIIIVTITLARSVQKDRSGQRHHATVGPDLVWRMRVRPICGSTTEHMRHMKVGLSRRTHVQPTCGSAVHTRIFRMLL